MVINWRANIRRIALVLLVTIAIAGLIVGVGQALGLTGPWIWLLGFLVATVIANLAVPPRPWRTRRAPGD